MIHVYAFAAGLQKLPARAGVQDGRLEKRTIAEISAVVSRASAHPAPGSQRDDVIAHGLVVEALNELAEAVLPVKFGETFADDEAFAVAAHELLSDLRGRLDRVRGCVEIGVRVTAAAGDLDVTASTGTGYMEAKLASLTEQDAIVTALHGPLERLARDTVVSSSGIHTAAYLVPRADVGAVQDHVERFASAHPELTVICTGPWAPYSFAGDESS